MAANILPTANLGQLSDGLGFLLRIAQVRVYDQFFNQCGHLGVKPGEFSVLWVISKNPAIRQSILCQSLMIKRSHMTKLVRSLENQHLVTRHIPDDDRRSVELTLTSAGQARVDEIAKWFFSFEDQLGSELTPEERETFVTLLRKFCAAELEHL